MDHDDDREDDDRKERALADLLADHEEGQGPVGATSARLEGVEPEVRARFKKVAAFLDRIEELWGPDTEASRLARSTATDRVHFQHSGDETPESLSRFERIEEIGQGGFGLVYLARDPMLKRELAVKVPRPDLVFSRETRQRFLREARAAAHLNHPNIVQILEAGEVGDRCYIAAEYIPGGNLALWLSMRKERVPARSAATFVLALARGVEHAHERGILHRDLKPANILLERRTEGSDDELANLVPKIADFGLAKILDEEGPHTRTGAILGTPAYMAPEQAMGKLDDIGTYTDVHALGAILYELLAGRPPFAGDNDMEIRLQVCEADPPRLKQFRFDVPADLEAIVLKCLDKSPRLRYASAKSFCEDLERLLRGEPTEARPLGRLARAARWARRKPMAAALVGVITLGTLAAAAGTTWYAVQLRAALAREEESLQAAIEAREIAEDRERLSREYRYGGAVRMAQIAHESSRPTQALEFLREARELRSDRAPGFEWRLLNRMYKSSRADFVAEGFGSCNHVAVSPDESMLVTGYASGELRLWDARTGATLRSRKLHDPCVNHVYFTADGKRLVSAGCDHLVRIARVEDLEEELVFAGHAEPVTSLVVPSVGDRIISGGEKGPLLVWSATTGKGDRALGGSGNLSAGNFSKSASARVAELRRRQNLPMGFDHSQPFARNSREWRNAVRGRRSLPRDRIGPAESRDPLLRRPNRRTGTQRGDRGFAGQDSPFGTGRVFVRVLAENQCHFHPAGKGRSFPFRG